MKQCAPKGPSSTPRSRRRSNGGNAVLRPCNMRDVVLLCACGVEQTESHEAGVSVAEILVHADCLFCGRAGKMKLKPMRVAS